MKRIIQISMLGLMLVSVLGHSAVLAQQTPAENALYLQVIDKLEQLKPTPGIDVVIGTEKDEYLVTEPMEFRFQANKDCYMVLMDIGAAWLTDNKLTYGDITFLVPNARFRDNKIEGGRVYSTVYDFNLPITVVPPSGYDTVNLFCSPQPFNLFETDFDGQMAYTITPNDDEKLRNLLTHLEQLEQQQWGGSSVSFLIKDPNDPLPLSEAMARGVRKYGAMPPIGATGTTGKGKFFPPIGATGTTGNQK